MYWNNFPYFIPLNNLIYKRVHSKFFIEYLGWNKSHCQIKILGK